MSVSDYSSSQLEYRSEGNASICFTIKHSDLVLKLPKTDVDSASFDVDTFKMQTDQVAYHENVMKKHFDSSYLCGNLKVVGPFEENFVEKLMRECEEQRPLPRRIKTVNPGDCRGLIMEDACRFPEFLGLNLSVEIKPKFGAVSGTDTICRYCMHQKLKLSSGKISSISRYCPTDLFSGDEECMNFAIQALIDDPQNNLKIFEDGTPRFHDGANPCDLSFLSAWSSYGDEGDSGSFTSLVVKALLQNSSRARQSRPSRYCVNSEASRRGLQENYLDAGSCLGQLFHAQTSSPIDVSEAASLYGRLDADPEWKRRFQERMVSNCIANNVDETHLALFLFAACARDCSVIVTFGRRDDREKSLSTKIKIIDLDPKPVCRIPVYLKLDKSIRETTALTTS